MNEPSFPMDDDLNRFEQDLKSLTPRHILIASPVRSMLPMHDLGITSPPDFDIVTEQQSHRLPLMNRAWLKTVSISWVTGLVAGLLVSTIWTRLVNETTPNTEPTLISENGASSMVIDSSSQDATPPNLTSTPPYRSQPYRSQLPSHFGEQSFANANRHTSLNFRDNRILHPFMSLNAVNWNSAIMPSAKRLTGTATRMQPDYEQYSAPDSDSGTPQIISPNSFPKSQGQRQLLKSLMKSQDLFSI
jgi:hypothetical protein